METKFKKLKKGLASVFIISISLTSFSPIFAKKAEAQWITWDPGNFVPNLADTVKDYGLDAVAWAIVNKVIERMAKSTVNWINSGFKGNPAFISNPESYFRDLGDKVAGQFIFTHPYLNSLCSPIKNKIRIALTKTHIGDTDEWQCTLSDVEKNLDAFVNDFEQGGWDSFYTVSQEMSESPLGGYLKAEGELLRQISQKTSLKQQELNWGNGFLSWKTCKIWSTPGEITPDMQVAFETLTGSSLPDEPGSEMDELDSINMAQPECFEEQVNTPGTVISDQLNKTIGLGSDKLAVADEINEIVSALLNQLVGQIVGGAGKGLRGLSGPSTTNNNQRFTDSLGRSLTQTPVVGYYCFDDDVNTTNQDGTPNSCYDTDPNFCRCPDNQDTRALNQPPFDPNVSPTGGTLVSPDDVLPFLPSSPPTDEETPPVDNP